MQNKNTEPLLLDIAAKVLQLRQSLGLTQKQFAELTGVPQATLSRLETGKMNPTVDFLSRLVAKAGKRLVIDFVWKVAHTTDL